MSRQGYGHSAKDDARMSFWHKSSKYVTGADVTFAEWH
jgi:hypothetical protein